MSKTIHSGGFSEEKSGVCLPSVTPRRMKGATVVLRAMPAARPQAATAPPAYNTRHRHFLVSPFSFNGVDPELYSLVGKVSMPHLPTYQIYAFFQIVFSSLTIVFQWCGYGTLLACSNGIWYGIPSSFSKNF